MRLDSGNQGWLVHRGVPARVGMRRKREHKADRLLRALFKHVRQLYALGNSLSLGSSGSTISGSRRSFHRWKKMSS